MAEGVAIRTFMKLRVLDAIPATGSISLHDLAKATGAQESLLGMLSQLFLLLQKRAHMLTGCCRTNGSCAR
jgi:hypothetical protein